MFRPRSLFIWGIAFILAVLAGCSSTPPGPRVPTPTQEPILVDGQSLPPLAFPGIFINIEPGARLGSAFEGAGKSRTHDYNWGPNFSAETPAMNDDVIDMLVESGYRTVPWQDGGVKKSTTGEPALELRGTVMTLEINSFSEAGGYHQAYIEVTWELHDPASGTALFRGGTAGFKRQNEHSAGIFRKAFDFALMNLLADEDFVAAVKNL